tara:strand:+ start:21173 stop:21880 length:708 start_codon:yes stop_codon:yes gene_type:complete
MSFLEIIIVATGFLALYWVFWGQRKYNEMFIPKRKTKLKAILFDMDGVIIDSFEASFKIFNEMRKLLKFKPMSKEEYKKKAWGRYIGDNAKEYLKIDSMDEVREEYGKSVSKHRLEAKLMPKAKEVLKKIRKKKIKTGLVTNTNRKFVMRVLNRNKIKDLFDVVVTVDDVEKPKPHPDPIFKACEKLNILPDETIFVGDTNNDYKAGKSAGCLVVGLNTHGDLVISKLDDLLGLL